MSALEASGAVTPWRRIDGSLGSLQLSPSPSRPVRPNPMTCSVSRVSALALFAALCTSSASAQWPSDPGLNLSVADGFGEQILPKIAPTADGGCYVSWFDGGAGYDVRLQRLDAAGNELWAHNGVLVRDRSFSSVQDYGLDVDASGAALLAFRDDNFATEQVTAARVDASGTLSWGAAGVQLTSTTAFIASPKITGTANGDVVVSWTENNLARTQRLTSGGATVWAAPVDLTPAVGNYSVSDLHASGDDVILAIVHQTGTSFLSPKHLKAQKFDAAGAALWGAAPVAVFDGGSLQIGNFPSFILDGSGGAVFSWYGTGPLQCYAQRILASGAEAFPHNGSVGSTDPAGTRVSPAVCFDAATSTTFMFWEEQNGSQSTSGLSGQKFDATGSAQWGATGSTLLPLSTTEINWVRTLTTPTGAYVFWHESPAFGQDTGHAAVVNGAGAFAVGPLAYASTPSNKLRLDARLSAGGTALLAWGDSRVDGGDVFMQSVQPDGTLGGAGQAYTQYCFGQGCPCANDDPSAGCANSTGGGALLDASGSASVASSTLVLSGSGLPAGQPGLYFQGLNAVGGGSGVSFGDGLRCAGGGVVRLQVRASDALGTSSTSADLAVGGGVTAGDTRTYQLWYRDPAGSVCGTGFNLSNGVQLVWAP